MARDGVVHGGVVRDGVVRAGVVLDGVARGGVVRDGIGRGRAVRWVAHTDGVESRRGRVATRSGSSVHRLKLMGFYRSKVLQKIGAIRYFLI